ncbi:MAG: hypothetical protein Q8R39_01915 [bacterium]|nr:hypothetical protein [bacterium]MDZ4284559.1 hypothetical protein [Patescibacteria group bacterium]
MAETVPVFTIKESLRFGWETTKANLTFLAGTFLVSIAPSIAGEALGLDERDGIIPALFVIAAVVVQAGLGLGLTKIHLRFARGEIAEWRDLFSCGHLLLPYLGAAILYGLVVVFGLILLIVPGVIWSVKYGLYFYVLLDEHAPPFVSLQRSAEITKGVRWQLFLFALILGLVNVAGAFAFGVGLLITVPVTAIAGAYVYIKLRERLVPAAEPPEQHAVVPVEPG